jgi:acyl phosphate:glycerol-3-phosphate acyltransferase
MSFDYALIIFIFAYLIGAIPFGLVLTRLAGLGDLRTIGSGNIGATNVLRTGRKDLALATLLLDAGKAGLAALIAIALFNNPLAGYIAGTGAFIGHLYPVYLKFKGGKGVATFFGTLLGVAWPIFLIAVITWLIAAFTSRISAVGGLAAAVVVPIIALTELGNPALFIMTVVMSALMVLAHRANIARLMAGTEPRMGSKKSGDGASEEKNDEDGAQ